VVANGVEGGTRAAATGGDGGALHGPLQAVATGGDGGTRPRARSGPTLEQQ
jgi:hypothetical protein